MSVRLTVNLDVKRLQNNTWLSEMPAAVQAPFALRAHCGQDVRVPRADKMSAFPGRTRCPRSQGGQDVRVPRADKMSAFPGRTRCPRSQGGQDVRVPRADKMSAFPPSRLPNFKSPLTGSV